MKYSRGNILFLILIGVALFGVLAYAVTQGSRGGGKGDISDEQADILAGQVIQMADDIATAVTRLQIVRGCEDEEIDFANDVAVLLSDGSIIFPDGHNPNAPTNGRCSVFKPEGSGVTPKLLPSGAAIKNQSTGYNVAGTFGPMTAHVDGLGTDTKQDLVLYMNYLEENVCIKINNKLGITNPGGVPPVDARSGSTNIFNGVYVGTGRYGDDSSEIYGKKAFCFMDASAMPDDHDYVFITVLIAR